MTCILALEMASGDDYVQVSRNAGITATDAPGDAGRSAVLSGRPSVFADVEES